MQVMKRATGNHLRMNTDLYRSGVHELKEENRSLQKMIRAAKIEHEILKKAIKAFAPANE